MKRIETPEELAVLIKDDYPISKDGLLKKDLYASFLKEDVGIEKEHYISLVLSTVDSSLELFPQYPNFMEFLWWVRQSEIDTVEFYNKLFVFLNEKWTEESYPERVFERLFVIEHIVGKTGNLSSFEWVEKTSSRALEENIWKKYDIKYLFGESKQEKKEVLLEMGQLSLFSKLYFSNELLLRMPDYLKDFSKDELLDIFTTNKEKVDTDTWQKIEKWLTVFSKEN